MEHAPFSLPLPKSEYGKRIREASSLPTTIKAGTREKISSSFLFYTTTPHRLFDLPLHQPLNKYISWNNLIIKTLPTPPTTVSQPWPFSTATSQAATELHQSFHAMSESTTAVAGSKSRDSSVVWTSSRSTTTFGHSRPRHGDHEKLRQRTRRTP